MKPISKSFMLISVKGWGQCPGGQGNSLQSSYWEKASWRPQGTKKVSVSPRSASASGMPTCTLSQRGMKGNLVLPPWAAASPHVWRWVNVINRGGYACQHNHHWSLKWPQLCFCLLSLGQCGILKAENIFWLANQYRLGIKREWVKKSQTSC